MEWGVSDGGAELSSADSGGGNGRVLVVDDTEQIRHLIRVNLELEGYDVMEASDGQAALEMLRDTDASALPDVITVDALMPRRDGWWTVSMIRADPRLESHPGRHGHRLGPAAPPGPGRAGSGRRLRRQAVRPGRAAGPDRHPGRRRPGLGRRLRPAAACDRATRPERCCGAPRLGRVTPEQLALAIRSVLAEAVAAGDLAVAVPEEVRVERPRNRDHGDWSTNIALQLAKAAGVPPREVADALAARLGDVAGRQGRRRRRPGLPQHHPGRRRRRASWPAPSSRPGPAYGRGDAEPGTRINLEFVSANPTGPIHLGGTRWAAVGDALARILQAAGRRGRPGSTTSTTTARRSTGSRARCWPRPRASRRPRTATPATTSATSPRGCWRSSPAILDLPDDEAQEVLPGRSAST